MKLIWSYLKRYKNYIVINAIMAIGFIFIELGIPTLLEQAINTGFGGGDHRYTIKIAMLMLLFAIIGLFSLIGLAYSTNRLASGINRDMRRDIFRHVQQFSHVEYEEFGVSRLITNTGSDSYQIMQFLLMAIRTGLMAPLMMIASFFLIGRKSPTMAWIMAGSIPIMLIGIALINKFSKPLSMKQQVNLDNINLNMRESLSGLRVIRAFNNEESQEERFLRVNQIYTTTSKSLFKLVSVAMPLFTIIFTILIALVLWIGSGMVDQRLMEFGTLAAFVEYFFHALFSFIMLATVFMSLPRTMVSAKRISQVLAAEPTIDPNPTGVTETETHGIIEFDNVSFAYPDAEEPVIRNVSFTAKPGETIAFIGSTGSGKSTLIQLIPRFFDVSHGRILIDGVDVRDYNLDTLRKKIGYVPQKALLFSGSIKDNLSFGKNDATLEEIKEAADIAQATDFIESRPLGYDDILAEGGVNLSGGQKQRLCIARALVRKPEIYIFDDSFSALDYKTDATLRQRLAQTTQDSTVLIVAQRVGTIMNADKILVLDTGEVVASGTHKELLKTSPIYYEIASSQLTKEELGE